MNRTRGFKLGFLAAAVMLAAQSASAVDYIVNILHPWQATPDRQAQPVHIISAVVGPAFPGAPMTPYGDDWYTYKFATAAKPAANSEFFFASYIPTAFNATGSPDNYYNGGVQFNFGDAFFNRNATEIWIIPQGAGKAPIITTTPQAKKVAFLFNPWPENAPMVKIGTGVYKNMRMAADPSRCGWYAVYFMAAPFTVHFKSIFGTDTYGMGGMNTAAAIDLASGFATSDTLFILPTPAPGGPAAVSKTLPIGVAGQCSFNLAVSIRDFSSKHPDFEEGRAMGDVVVKGMVQPTLGLDSKPVKGINHFSSDFANWFKDSDGGGDPTKANHHTCQDIKLSKTEGGQWGYDSYFEESHGWFPIDKANAFGETFLSGYKDRATGNYKIGASYPENKQHNFHFCMEMHATFKYKPGQVFKFIGDDDVWAFIDKKLAIDLGGTHGPEESSVDLSKLGLTAGQEYPFDFFFCERQTEGSDLLIETSIFFEQQQSVFTKKITNPDGSISYEIWERTTGDKSCTAPKEGETKLAKSTFQVSGPSATPAKPLVVGIVNYGSIVIDATTEKITLDTTKITGLRPGPYVIIFTTASGKASTIPFTVPGTVNVEFTDKRVVNEILGTSVPVTIQSMLNGTPDTATQVFRLAPEANLLVFQDSALTIPILSTTDLTTVGGVKKVYVTSRVAKTYSLNLMAGPAKNVSMDTFGNLTFIEQPKVATPTATPPGAAFITPIGVMLNTATVGAVIFYTTDGTPPATSATGSTRQYTAAIPLSATAKIKAIAVKPGWVDSDIFEADYTYTPPVAISKAWYLDMNGDGRIETVIIDLEKSIPVVPAKLTFKIADPSGKVHEKTAANAEIVFAGAAKTRVVATLAAPFDFGVTSVGNRAVSGQIFEQPNIPSLAGTFPVDDSVPPVVTKGTVMEPDSSQLLKRILITLSETVNLPLGGQDALVFKRDGSEMASADVKIHRIEKTGDRDYAVYIDSTSNLFPIVGDSVALNVSPDNKDLAGNIPSKKAFLRLDGIVPKPKPIDMYVTFPNSRKDAPAGGVEPQGDAVFIPVDGKGMALTGDARDGKCQGACFTGDNLNFVGPVFHIVTPGAVAYEFKIFNNVGEFVASGTGRITDKDLALLPKTNDASGIKYMARVVWTGRTSKGGKAGTGAYILQTTMISDKDAKTGAGPGRASKRVTFGMLRSFRGT
jgi:fibro-slime domain-containing protein